MDSRPPPLLRFGFWFLLALAVPIVPFLIWGERLESWITEKIQAHMTPMEIAEGAIAALTADILLPIPSSFVGTFVGIHLEWPAAVGVIWTGLMCGACLGFALSRYCGAPLAARFSSPDDLDRLTRLAKRQGARILIYTRALPVLAEATVLLLGAARMEWPAFLWPTAGSNLIIAAVYATLGYFGRVTNAGLWALLASVAIPIVATFFARRFWPTVDREDVGSNDVLSNSP